MNLAVTAGSRQHTDPAATESLAPGRGAPHFSGKILFSRGDFAYSNRDFGP